MNCVADASILASFLLNNDAGRAFVYFREEGIRPAMPDWGLLETASALWKATQLARPVLSRDDAVALIEAARSLAIDWFPAEPHVLRAFELAMKYRITPYDGIYLSLAHSLGVKLVTADQKLIDRTKSSRIVVHWTAMESGTVLD